MEQKTEDILGLTGEFTKRKRISLNVLVNMELKSFSLTEEADHLLVEVEINIFSMLPRDRPLVYSFFLFIYGSSTI